MVKIKSSEITPEHVYLNRRTFMKSAGLMAAGAVLAACAGPEILETTAPAGGQEIQTQAGTATSTAEPEIPPQSEGTGDELGNPLNSYEDITNYNNFYEFSLEKTNVAKESKGFVSSPWQIEVGGLVNKPKTFGLEDLLKFESQERIYRLRCVEGWSMVIPWQGFRLSQLLQAVEPSAGAKYVRFETLLDPERMPGQKSSWFGWPYVEGLRLDEAMNDLTILATGLYGKDLLPQNGAPVRLVVPWKYGFKSIKSIVKIDLVEERPVSLWMDAAPEEYGFYANVNPEVDHPRWSQSSERRIGELGRRDTLMFNGYADEVGALYADMDLRVNY